MMTLPLLHDATTAALALAFVAALVAAFRLAQGLRESEEKFRMVVNTMQEGVLIRDGVGEVVLANPQGLEILGLNLDQLRGTTSTDMTWQAIHEDGRPWPRETWPSHLALDAGTPQRDQTMGVRTAWGETVWLSVSAIPLFRRKENRPYLVVTTLSDITVRKRREERTRRQVERANDANAELARANVRLAEAAQTDGLTGLRNHRAFKERLDEEVARSGRNGQPLSLIILDVDEFKSYNDAFGHPEGDEALRRVAGVLAAVARTTDLVARYGGEEFAVLLPEADVQAAVQVAERLRAAIEAAPWPKRAITASFGVAALRADDEPKTLIASADAALYESKRAGRNRVSRRIGGSFQLV